MLIRRRADSTFFHILILAALCLPYCINLGVSSIWDANEAFYAETPREMLESGDYLAPHFNYQPRAQKPPLTYWIILVAYKLFGISEYSVRLPSALAAIGTILLSWGAARLLFGARAALFCAAIVATTARVFILARRLPIDILLLFFLTGTFFFIVRAIQRKSRRSWIPVYIMGALAFLTKGPIAVIIPASAYLIWCLRRRQFSFREINLFQGAAIFAIIVLPWYLCVYVVHGLTYISPFFLRDNFGRFATETLGPSRSLFYYFPVFATDFFPWSLLFLAPLCILWVRRKEDRPIASLSFGFPIIWCAVIFILFSFSKNKQEYYIAPMYPAAAVIISGMLDRLSQKSAEKRGEDVSIPKSWTFVCGFLFLSFLLLSAVLPYVLRSFVPNLPAVLHYGPSAALVAGSLWLLWGICRKKQIQSFAAVLLPIWTIFLAGALLYLPALESFRPVKSFCRTIEAFSRGGMEAGTFRAALPSMVFYLRQPVFEENSPEQMLKRFQSDKQVFCVLRRKDFGYFADRKDLRIYIFDRRSRFAVRFGDLDNAGYSLEDELLLVSNRPREK